MSRFRTESAFASNMEKDSTSCISSELPDEKYKQKLLDDIGKLNAYISRLKFAIETPKFGQLRWTGEAPRLLRDTVTSHDIPDVETELRSDLYRFAGMRCTTTKSRFVFEISGGTNDLYAVEILTDNDGHGKLGKWVLPMFIDMQEILSRHPVHNLNNVKHFLRSCKHYVECYIYRAKQFEELRDLIAEIKNARLSQTTGITRIELTMLGVKDIDSGDTFNVSLYLCYNFAEVRPYKLLPDTEENERPSTDLLERLSKYFKPFLKKDLGSAFQQVSESQVSFVWEKVMADNKDSIEICNESGDEDVGFLSKFLRRSDKEATKRPENKARDQSALHDNETEMSLRVEREKREGVDVMEITADGLTGLGKETESYKRPVKITVKTRGVEKLQGEEKLRKLKKGVAKVKRGNDRGIANSSNLESNVASTTNHSSKRKRTKNCRDNKSARVKYKSILSNADNNNDNDEEHLEESASEKSKRARKKHDKRDNINDELSKNLPGERRSEKKITWLDKVEGRKQHSILTSSSKKRANMSCSTPFSNKLPDKRKFFQGSSPSSFSEICDESLRF